MTIPYWAPLAFIIIVGLAAGFVQERQLRRRCERITREAREALRRIVAGH